MSQQAYQDPAWASAHRITLDTSRMMADRVGKEHGIHPDELAADKADAARSHDDLAAKRQSGKLPFFDLPYQDITPITALAEGVRDRFENFLLVGVGGSSLGPKATQAALSHSQYNVLPRETRGGPRLFLLENVDPDTVGEILGALDPNETCVNVVSKSGGTAETAANFLVAKAWLEKGVKDPAEHLIATTDPVSGDLRAIADGSGWKSLEIPPLVGGRFSQLTPVGLLPAAVCGVDIGELLAGAADMEARTRDCDLMNNPAYHLAALHYLADTKKGKPISVMMPYSDGLALLANWFVQLWAESLGKAVDLEGNPAHTGQTPLPAVGAIDQHSQVQLFVEGPNDKMTTFLKVGSFDQPGPIPSAYEEIAALGYLGGRTLQELINAEQAATEMVLTENKRPNLRIDLPRLNPFAMGQLFYLFEVMTAFAGGLYRINPFDQPGVEHAKRLTYGAMGRDGYPNLLG